MLSLTNFIGGFDSMVLLALAIVLCAFVFEDITTVIVGVLAADGTIPIPVALIALYGGIALGDTVLYTLGSFARTHPRLAHYVEHDFTAPFRSWLLHRYAFKIFSGHFVPGLRFTTFVASGFFSLPLRTYVPMAVTGGLILEVMLFSVSYWFGSLTSAWIGPIRWGVAGVFLFILFLIARHNVATYRAKKLELSGTGVDTHRT